MKIGYLACAFGRHRVDQDAIRRVTGGVVARCGRCSTPLEQVAPNYWEVQQVRDAGLSHRLR
ncbi:hypothetical protein [Qipengyuania zhejiangensis]|uniref:hypothetical protein n=1 Tax=Qipengyuania zhejiangensis TaxID=3077782 RepID=UPI002D76DDC7|nr:hypothetical protein [Qipengyuania sp. Z2]